MHLIRRFKIEVVQSQVHIFQVVRRIPDEFLSGDEYCRQRGYITNERGVVVKDGRATDSNSS